MRRIPTFVGLMSFACLLSSGSALEPTPINALQRTANGTLELRLPLPANRYGILYRSPDLQSTGRPIALVESEGGIGVARDTAPAKGHGFLRVGVFDTASPADSDGDGIDDLSELIAPIRLNPFNPAPEIDFADGAVQLPDRALYDDFSHRDNFPGAAGIREVKFVIFDVHTESPDLYFVDSKAHQYHFYFSWLGAGRYSSFELSLFNSHTYFTTSNRRNVAGSIVAHDNYLWPDGRQGIYTMEFWPSDGVAFQFVETAFEMIASGAPFLDGKFAYHPASETQRTRLRSESESYLNSNVPVIQTEELFGNQTFAALHTGVAFGRLRIAAPGQTLSARDVVIFENIPNDITHLAGILTEVPQTPLSHINLKARQNDTPNAYLKDATLHPDIAPLIGQDVRLEIDADGFQIRAATAEEVELHLDAIRPASPQTPVRDLSATEVEDLDTMEFSDAAAFGSKAANLAELRNVLPTSTPDGVAIPFYFYDQFMIYNGYYTEAAAMMADPDFIASPEVRDQKLEEFRERMENFGNMPAWMLVALGNVQAEFPPNTSLRARSSTNNEDLLGFNGAGLYESYTHHPNEGHFSKTARQVWAGLWTYRAFEEREFWRIDHLVAAMGILVHPNFAAEQANGVGVTKNIFIPGPGWRGHYVNAQLGENPVTNPVPGVSPEEFTIADLGGAADYEIQYIRFSSLVPEGETVLSREQVLELNEAMRDIHQHFEPLYSGGADFAMELEFKIDSSGNLAVKQARPWVD